MKPDKLCIISAGFAPVPALQGGAVEKLTTLILQQNEIKHYFDIDIYTIADRGLSEYHYKNARIIEIKPCRWDSFFERNINRLFRKMHLRRNYLPYRRKVLKALKQNADIYDHILIENARELVQGVSKLASKETKIYLHLHNDSSSKSMPKDIDRKAALRIDKLIAVSKYIQNDFITRSGIGKNKCRVLYNCLFTSCDKPHDIDIKNLKKKYGIGENEFVYLYVGRINYEKGVHILAKAFSHLKAKNARLVICGGTWGTEFTSNRYLEKVKQVLGDRLKDTIFTGYIPGEEIGTYYAVCDAVVIPSVCKEAFGMVMLESAMRKKAVIATKSGGMREILDDYAAYWLDIDDCLPRKMTLAMEHCCSHRDELAKMGEYAFHQVNSRDCFKQSGYLDRMRNIIFEVEQ